MRTVAATILAALITLGGFAGAGGASAATGRHTQVAPAGLRWDVHTNGVSWD